MIAFLQAIYYVFVLQTKRQSNDVQTTWNNSIYWLTQLTLSGAKSVVITPMVRTDDSTYVSRYISFNTSSRMTNLFFCRSNLKVSQAITVSISSQHLDRKPSVLSQKKQMKCGNRLRARHFHKYLKVPSPISI